MKILPSILVVSAAVALSGCASLFKGTHEKLTVRTTPSGALCQVSREAEGVLDVIVTPGATYLRRDRDPVMIVCEKDGHTSARLELRPRKDIFAGAEGDEEPFANLGFPLDVVNSAIYDLPNEAELRLPRKN